MSIHGYRCHCDNCLPRIYSENKKFGREQDKILKDELARMKPSSGDCSSIDFNALVKKIKRA